jgi:hypothetical protein
MHLPETPFDRFSEIRVPSHFSVPIGKAGASGVMAAIATRVAKTCLLGDGQKSP